MLGARTLALATIAGADEQGAVGREGQAGAEMPPAAGIGVGLQQPFRPLQPQGAIIPPETLATFGVGPERVCAFLRCAAHQAAWQPPKLSSGRQFASMAARAARAAEIKARRN